MSDTRAETNAEATAEAMAAPRGRLAVQVAAALRRALEAGAYAPGTRLPSETQLAQEHGVSRTVVREAIATLSFEGRVQARKGAGIFALAPPAAAPPLLGLDTGKVSSVIELLELRTAVEVEAAALASARRSAAQEEALVAAHRAVIACLEAGAPTRDADFIFHLRLAEAANNPRFPEFLNLIRLGIIPRGELQGGAEGARPRDYNRHLAAEHSAIVDAVLEGDEAAARRTMRAHLDGSLARYRSLLRSARLGPMADR